MVQAYRKIEDIPAEKGLPTLEEYARAEDDGILIIEWNIRANRAHLTYDEKRAFRWHHIIGFSLKETADAMEIDEKDAKQYLKAAYSRLRQIPYEGLWTVLVEIFGLTDVMQAMEDGQNDRNGRAG
jgi:DNA-directed RNA polymerase specialized sigma24 family protein